jgi:hypothetical protein
MPINIARAGLSGAGLTLALGALALAGCSSSGPATAHATVQAQDACRGADQSIAGLAPPTDPAAGLRYALDRYSAIELAVSTVTDSSLPAGAPLRRSWLDPAQSSLRTGRPALSTLQQAVAHHDPAAAGTAFAVAARAGSLGPDVLAAVGRAGLPECTQLFTPAVPPTSW